MRKDNGKAPTPFRERLTGAAPRRLPTERAVPSGRLPLTPAEICHQIAGLLTELAAALEREEERLDGEIASLGNALDQIGQPERWPALMYREMASAYLGVAPGTLDQIVRDGHIPARQAPGQRNRVYRLEDLNDYRSRAQ